LVLLGCDLFEGNLEHATPAMLAIELFHNFTLVHDDIMDLAPIRRGKETVYKKWNSNIAILSGDTMFAMACEYISGSDPMILPALLKVFTQTARNVCEGQQLDMNFESSDKVDLADYLEMIRLKTAVLLGCGLELGSMIAGASPAESRKLYSFGENIGLAFQLQDDLLDAFGDEKKFGKEIGGDILTHKKTFLFLKALELATGKEKSELELCFSGKPVPPAEKIRRVMTVYETLKIKEITQKEIEKYFSLATGFSREIKIPADRKKILEEFAMELLHRDY
jgi:geranylgeranyl diphosphate synthase type II